MKEKALKTLEVLFWIGLVGGLVVEVIVKILGWEEFRLCIRIILDQVIGS